MFKYYHKKFAIELGNKIVAAGKHAKLSGISEPPDMIVHSFGSLIFATLLRMDEFKHLVFGRVIVAGGIVKPDFEWSEFIDANRIEVVFNHCSKKDVTVLFSQYFIPNSGPSGAKGFTDGRIFNVLDLKFTHSSYFDPNILERNLSNKGVWDVFLRDPIGAVTQRMAIYYPDVNWKPSNIFLRLVTWSIAIMLPIIIIIVFIFQLLKLV